MRRVVFVGYYNRGKKRPFDISTHSGQMVDQIVKGLTKCEIVKSNLCECSRKPDQNAIHEYKAIWYEKYQPSYDDIYVLIGVDLHRVFSFGFTNKIYVLSPDSFKTSAKRDKHVSNAISKINTILANCQ